MQTFVERYAQQIYGVLSCFDRTVLMGSLVGVGHCEGMTSYLYSHNIRIFDYPQFAQVMRDELRANAESLAKENGIEIEFVRSRSAFRKEDHVREILATRGDQPGLVHILSAMEPCGSFDPWHDKRTGKTFLRYADAKCLHYYFYFVDKQFGLCYLRVPTWAPFRLQFYFNGHNWLANRMKAEAIEFKQIDNTFVQVGDFARAQEISDSFSVKALHERLKQIALLYCPVLNRFADVYPEPYHWSIMQAEYATDVVFKRQSDLRPLYDGLVRTAIHAVKVDNVATFLGKKLTGNYQDEAGNDFHTRIEGTRVKHHMGPVAIKMYDKQALVLRIETTVNDVSFFRHYREVVHLDKTKEMKLARMQKTIYSLGPLRELLVAANKRYLAFLSQLADNSAGTQSLNTLSMPVLKNDRTYKGFNLFDDNDLRLVLALERGEWNISGFQNSSLRHVLTDRTGPQISRMLKRLHLHGLIRKVGKTYKYYLTQFGQSVLITALKLRELVVIPQLAQLQQTLQPI